METNASVQKAEGILKNLLYFMDVAATVSSQTDISTITLNIEAKDSGVLIGFKGETLRALEHLVNTLFRQEERGFYIKLDVGGYKQEQEKRLQDMAKTLADRVKSSGRTEVLRPMTARERRLVHMTISDIPEIISESTGDEPFRRIVIRKKQ